MDGHFVPVTDRSEVDQLFERSQETPVILFKHDPYCPISAAAERALARVPEEVDIIDVAHDKELSQDVAKRTGVRHESPQVIVLRDGRPVWSASHFDITTDAVERAAGK